MHNEKKLRTKCIFWDSSQFRIGVEAAFFGRASLIAEPRLSSRILEQKQKWALTQYQRTFGLKPNFECFDFLPELKLRAIQGAVMRLHCGITKTPTNSAFGAEAELVVRRWNSSGFQAGEENPRRKIGL